MIAILPRRFAGSRVVGRSGSQFGNLVPNLGTRFPILGTRFPKSDFWQSDRPKDFDKFWKAPKYAQEGHEIAPRVCYRKINWFWKIFIFENLEFWEPGSQFWEPGSQNCFGNLGARTPSSRPHNFLDLATLFMPLTHRVISNTALHLTDRDSSPSDLFYKLQSLPQAGVLVVASPGTRPYELRLDESFSEEQIQRNQVHYRHNIEQGYSFL